MGSWPVIILAAALGGALVAVVIAGLEALRDLMNRPD